MSTQKQKILELFDSGRWVPVEELQKVAWRYGARLYDLRTDGYVFEKKKQENGLEAWKIAYRPKGRLAMEPIGHFEMQEEKQNQDSLFELPPITAN